MPARRALGWTKGHLKPGRGQLEWNEGPQRRALPAFLKWRSGAVSGKALGSERHSRQSQTTTLGLALILKAPGGAIRLISRSKRDPPEMRRDAAEYVTIGRKGRRIERCHLRIAVKAGRSPRSAHRRLALKLWAGFAAISIGKMGPATGLA